MGKQQQITGEQQNTLLNTLQRRFEKNSHRHTGIDWKKLQARLESKPSALWSLYQMEGNGGEPDLVAYDKKSDRYIFFDCSAESPKGRRSLCYDQEALNSRKEFKPANSVLNMAAGMGIEILSEEDYQYLQTLGRFDTKTSSWLETPAPIRKLGGAIFGDCRYNHVFIYHNGAESYYAARGFRGKLIV